MFRSFPLILIAVVIYNFLALGGWAMHTPDLNGFLAQSVSFHLISGDWKFSMSDLIMLVTLFLLFVETIRATRTTTHEVVNHALSMLTFVVALIEFIIVKGFATSTFFFIVTMALFDVVAGYTISIIAAEHNLGLGRSSSN